MLATALGISRNIERFLSKGSVGPLTSECVCVCSSSRGHTSGVEWIQRDWHDQAVLPNGRVLPCQTECSVCVRVCMFVV